jgi:small nuclear ribonucleoprotein (snRNP)-like protein
MSAFGVLRSLALGLALIAYSAPARSEEEPSAAQPAPVSVTALRASLGGEVTLSLRDGSERAGVLVAVADETVTLAPSGAANLTLDRAAIVQLRLGAASPITDAKLNAALGDEVWLELRDGPSAGGVLLSFTPDTVVLVDDRSVVHSVARGQLTDLGRRAGRRRFGANVSLLPGLMADVDIGLFRAYMSGSVVFPAALSGKLWGFSTGLGLDLPVSRRMPDLKIDIMAHANLMGVDSACSACNYPTAHVFGFGLAAGVHTTLDSGFTAGLTAPVIGYSVTPHYHGTTNAKFGYYYLSSLVGMPLAFMGYRF